MLVNGADVNTPRNFKVTALHVAAASDGRFGTKVSQTAGLVVWLVPL